MMIETLVNKCKLGKIEDEVLPVSGGLMHKMFKVRTSTGTYAVKSLNPEIMNRPGVMDNYAKAERLESILEKEGLPVVAALSFDGRKMLEEEGRYFYVFKWQEGSITDWNAISKEQCFKAGELLGRIHGIDSKTVEASEPGLSEIDFDKYLERAKGTPIINVLGENLSLCKEAQRKLNEARRALPSIQAIINDDMDPKNVMWHEGNPYVIDLECLEYGNPVYSCLNLSLQWSGTVTGNFNRENLKAFYEGYLKAYDNGFRDYDKLLGTAYTWVEWLEYNIRRALGMEGNNPEDIRLGEEEVYNTIKRIQYLGSVEKDICSALKEIFNTTGVSI